MAAFARGGAWNLNSYLLRAVKKSGVRNGMVVVQSRHTTAGLMAQEDEDGLLWHDLPKLLDRLVPEDAYYRHDDMTKRYPNVESGEPKNARAHLKYVLAAQASMTFIVRNRKIRFGKWVSVFLVDLDPSQGKSRKVDIAVFGE